MQRLLKEKLVYVILRQEILEIERKITGLRNDFSEENYCWIQNVMANIWKVIHRKGERIGDTR